MHDRLASIKKQGALDVERIRRDFPILATRINGRPLVYLDNAATTQKPRAVIEAIVRYYETTNANIHRGVYTLSQQATAGVDRAREIVARFLNAPEAAECIFVRGVTEAINLVAMSWGRAFLKPGDEVLLTALEHHSNIVPWQLACNATGATLRWLPMDEKGELRYDLLGEYITHKTRFIAIQHVSNALGTVHDVARITTAAKKATGGRALVLIDGAQHVGHLPTDVRAIGCDFYCFSGHKLFGPTGIGVLWGRREVLEAMPPFHGGGDMIESVTWEKTTYAPLPNKFEAGTPDIAGIIGLGAAIEYLESIGWEKLVPYEEALLDYAHKRLGEVPGLRIIGTAGRKAGVVSFILESPPMATLDIGVQLDALGIAVRTGHHCAQPLMEEFGIPGTARASFSFYNTRGEVDALVAGLKGIVAASRSRAPDKLAGAPAGRTTRMDRNRRTDEEHLPWPDPKGATPDEAAQELIDTFTMLTEAGEDPRDFVLELGRKIPLVPESMKNEATFVRGCMSRVWLISRQRPGTADGLDFIAESDAEIVKGLIAILAYVFAGQSARAILAYDVDSLLRRLNFQNLISVQRRSGVEAMIKRIRAVAQAMVNGGVQP